MAVHDSLPDTESGPSPSRVLWWEHLRQDARSAIRSIAKSPVTCLVAVVSLAGGIGSTTATLTLRNAIFYNPPPLYAQPSELSRVEISRPERPRAGVPGALLRDLAG